MAKVTEPVFEKEALLAAAGSFGTTREILAGALHDVKDPISKAQAQEKLEKFLQAPVKRK